MEDSFFSGGFMSAGIMNVTRLWHLSYVRKVQ